MPLNTLENMESFNLNSNGISWEKNWENNNASSLVVKKSTTPNQGKRHSNCMVLYLYWDSVTPMITSVHRSKTSSIFNSSNCRK